MFLTLNRFPQKAELLFNKNVKQDALKVQSSIDVKEWMFAFKMISSAVILCYLSVNKTNKNKKSNTPKATGK